MHVEYSRSPYSVYNIYLKDVEEEGVSIGPRIALMLLFQSIVYFRLSVQYESIKQTLYKSTSIDHNKFMF